MRNASFTRVAHLQFPIIISSILFWTTQQKDKFDFNGDAPPLNSKFTHIYSLNSNK